MTVLTRDVLVNGLRRDDVFQWMAEFSVHPEFLKTGFPELQVRDEQTVILPFSGGWKKRELVYRFIEADDSHAGRRIQILTEGKRLEGHLHYSLRTMKPSTDTMVTLHMDYDPGSVLGKVLENDINEHLAERFVQCLQQLKTNVEQALLN